MEDAPGRVLLNDVLIEAAKLTYEQRRARIQQCIDEGRHRWDELPLCDVLSRTESARYCGQCWSLIDRLSGTWCWPFTSFRPRSRVVLAT